MWHEILNINSARTVLPEIVDKPTDYEIATEAHSKVAAIYSTIDTFPFDEWVIYAMHCISE